MTPIKDEWYIQSCCLECRSEISAHKNVMLHRCSGCGRMHKVHRDATDKDLEDLAYAIRQLVHGNYKVI